MTLRQYLPPIPTTIADVKTVARVCRLVLSAPRYALVAIISFPFSMMLFVVPRNFTLVVDTVLSGSLPLLSRLALLFGLFPTLNGAAYTLITGVLLYLTAAIVSINVALLAYHVREYGVQLQTGASGTLGTLLGALGAGCASCGSALLAGVLSLLGISGSLTLLPLDGAEFLLVALVIALLSIYWVADALRGGMVRGCPIR